MLAQCGGSTSGQRPRGRRASWRRGGASGMPARCSPLRAKRTTSGTVFMRLSFMLSDSSFDMLPRSPGMSSRPFKLTFRTVRSLSCEAGDQNGRSESERPERGQPSTPQRECDSLTQPASPGHVGRTFANRVSSVLSMLPARRKGQGVAECGQMAQLEHTTGRRERGRRPGGVIFVRRERARAPARLSSWSSMS